MGAHDGASAPSKVAARSIFATFPSLPSGGRWSLRRVLQQHQVSRGSGAVRSSSCGPSRTSSSTTRGALRRRAPSCATCPGGCVDGLETVNVRRASRGTTVPVTTPYYREKHARRAKRRPGLYPALVVLGIYDRCTPKLASDAVAVAMLARWPKRRRSSAPTASPWMSVDRLSLRCAGPSGQAQRSGWSSPSTGAFVRVRRKKRGPKTKKGRNRFHTDWKEPKLLILYVVGDDGRPSQTWSPDHRRHAPKEAVLPCCCRTRGRSASTPLTRCSADGALPWIWQRIQRLTSALGLSPTQVLGLIELSCREATLGRGQAAPLERDATHPRLNRTRGLLKRARVDEVIKALRELCRRPQDPHAPQLLPEEPIHHNGRARASAGQRRRRKRHPSRHQSPHQGRIHLLATGERRRDSLLRSFYKSGRWNCLQRMAMTPVGVSA